MRSWAILSVLICGAGGAAAAPADPLDKPFAATPQELLAAARAAPAGDGEVVVLRDDETLTYDAAGRATRRFRVIAVVEKPAGVDDWGTLGLEWSPFYEDRPVVRARVIAPDATVADLDVSLATDAPVIDQSPSVFSDRRTLKVPLPRLSVGAVIEEEFTTADREPLLAAGSSEMIWIGRGVRVQRSVVVIDAPTARGVHVLTLGFAKAPSPKKVARGGRTTWTFDIGAIERVPPYEAQRPGDVPLQPVIGVATGASWAAIAADYARLIDAKLADPVALPPGVAGATPRETVDRTLAWLHAHVRYTGIELSQSAIVPFAPAETVRRGFGDCKDQATLLVGLLRTAGITADVAVLDDGPGLDIVAGLPGMGAFDHAIVRARVDGKDLWIDATEPDLPAGQLPERDQGRRALVIAAGTKGLVITPAATSADNRVREVRTYHLGEENSGRVTEITENAGAFWDDDRVWLRDTAHDDAEKNLGNYVSGEYHGKLVGFSGNAPADVTQPFRLTIDADHVKRAFTTRTDIDVYLLATSVLRRVPAIIQSSDDEWSDDVKRRANDYVWWSPHTYVVEHRLVLPPGFTAPALAADETRALGTMTLAITRKLDHGDVVITYRLDTGKARITHAELAATRAAVLALKKQDAEHVVITQTGAALLHDGKIKEAIAEYQRLIALHPKEALHWDQLADAYQNAGMGLAARRAAQKGVALEPKRSDAHDMLAWQLRHDTLGRDLGFDADRQGAIAEYRKALALDPDHVGALVDLAMILATDARGHLTDRTGDLAEVATLRRHALDLGGDVDQGGVIDPLLVAGKFADAARQAQDMPASKQRSVLLVTAKAATDGAEPALALAATLGSGATRDQIVGEAAGRLMILRRYDTLRAMSPALASNPQFAVLNKIEVAKLDPADPLTPVLLMSGSAMQLPITKPPWDPIVAADLASTSDDLLDDDDGKAFSSLPVAVIWDILGAAVHSKFTATGDAATGWRVTDGSSSVYIGTRHGRAWVIGAPEMPGGVGEEMLAALGRGDTKTATRWLDRLLADLDHAPEAYAVPKAELRAIHDDLVKQAGARPLGKDALGLLAALMIGGRDPGAVAPILRRCPVSGDDHQRACKHALVAVLMKQGGWKEAAELAGSITTATSSSHEVALAATIEVQAGRVEDAIGLCDAALAGAPDDSELLEARAIAALAAGGWGDAVPWFDKLVASGGPHWINDVAWAHLFYDPATDRAQELGAKIDVSQLQPQATNFVEHTLAAIAAESDQPYQAWQHLQRSLAARAAHDTPEDRDWYVVGRIAESYGLRDDAIAAYRRLKAPAQAQPIPSSYDFAQRDLKRLTAAH